MILIEFLPKYPIFRPDWECDETWTCSPSIFSLVPCTYSLLGRGSALVSLGDPVHLPLPCTLESVTLSLCFRAVFCTFSQQNQMLPPWLHSDCFSFLQCDKHVISAFTPKNHQPRVPSIAVIPCSECDATTFRLTLPYCVSKKRCRCYRKEGVGGILQVSFWCFGFFNPVFFK